MTLILDLPGDVQDAITQDARQHGQTPEQMALAALRRIYAPVPQKDNSQISEKNAQILSLVESFAAKDAQEAEQQARDLAELVQGVEEARPGQRQVFGEGFNP